MHHGEERNAVHPPSYEQTNHDEPPVFGNVSSEIPMLQSRYLALCAFQFNTFYVGPQEQGPNPQISK
jgi:hypothetical protein